MASVTSFGDSKLMHKLQCKCVAVNKLRYQLTTTFTAFLSTATICFSVAMHYTAYLSQPRRIAHELRC